jgi:hypothetical protein
VGDLVEESAGQAHGLNLFTADVRVRIHAARFNSPGAT